MDPDQVKQLMQSFRIRDLRRLLFTDDVSTIAHYLGQELLQHLPTILTVTEGDDGERDGDRRDMAYTVIEFERSHRHPDDFTRILHSALLTAAMNRDSLLVEVMIHSGGNFFHPDPGDDEAAGNIYDQISPIPEMGDVIDKYFPGVWNSVETGNIDDLRRLVNCWCSTDVYYKGESLIQLARRTGQESVIRLVTGAHYTLKLIHSFLGGNVPAIRSMLQQHPTPMSHLSEYGINLDFKHLSDKGAPLLFYVIQRNEVEIARLLVQNGCKIYTLMPDPRLLLQPDEESVQQTQQLQEVPVFYAGLSNPDLDPEMMSSLLSTCDQDPERMHDLLYRMIFQGRNCLEQAIHSSLNLPAFRILVSRAGAKVIADRNPMCKTARDVALQEGRKDYVDVIDGIVIEYLQHPHRYPHQRQILALFGYDLSDLVLHEAPVDPFYSLYPEYQSQVKRLAKAILDQDYESFLSLAFWTREDDMSKGSGGGDDASSDCTTRVSSDRESGPLFERLLIWDGREGEINPLPLLHRAVIHNRIDVVKLILQLKPPGQSIDCLFDHYRRTALHYAEASKDLMEISLLLHQHGASDHALDRVSG